MRTIWLSNEQIEFLQSQNYISVVSLKNREKVNEMYYISSYFQSTEDPNVFKVLDVEDLIVSHIRNNEEESNSK